MIKRKVTYKGEPRELSKGFGIGIKVEGMDDYINFWGFTSEEVSKKVPCKVGDLVEVEYEVKDGRHNGKALRIVSEVAGKTESISSSLNTIPIKTADELKPVDIKIGEQVQILEKIFEELQSTKIYACFEDNKEQLWDMIERIYWEVAE